MGKRKAQPGPPDREDRGDARGELFWALGLGALATLLAAVLSQRVFAGMPHVQDSIAQLFQARIFAEGMLRAPAPALPEFFQYHHMILQDGRWWSQYPPGHPAVLLVGVLLGAPWLVDPLMGGLFVVALVLLGPELFGAGSAGTIGGGGSGGPAAVAAGSGARRRDPEWHRRGVLVGRVAGVLALVSPFFLLMSAEFMSHPTALAGATWGLYGYVRLVRTGSLGSGLLAGAGFALALLSRPYSAVGVAVPVAVHAAATLVRVRRQPGARPLRTPSWLAMLGAAGAGAVLLLVYNQVTNGAPLRFGYEVLYGPAHGLGFGKGSWGTVHTFTRGLAQTWTQLSALSGRLFEWPGTSLWPLALGLLPGPRLALRWGLLLFPLMLLGVHVVYWYSDLCFGPRYVYEALAPLLLLSAFGLVRAGEWLAVRLPAGGARGGTRASFGHAGGGARGGRLARDGGAEGTPGPVFGRFALVITLLLVALPTVLGLVTRWPRLFAPPAQFASAQPGSPLRAASYFQFFGSNYWGVGPHLAREAERSVTRPALVFVHFAEPTIDHPTLRYLQYGCAFAWQEPNLAEADVVWARDLGAQNEALVREFPGRNVYLYEGNVESGTLRRVGGP